MSWSLVMLILALTLSILMSSSSVKMVLYKGLMNSNLFDLISLTENKNFMFLTMVLLISLSVFYWGAYYMMSPFKLMVFFIVLLGFVFSMLTLLLSNSLMWVFLGWEGLGVTSFVLIIFYQNWLSGKGGLLTLLTNRVGDGLLILVLGLWWSSALFYLTSEVSSVILIMILIVAFTKSAQWPFMNWLPAAMAAPTPVSALVHSSTLVTAGIWLLIRFKQSIWSNSSIWVMGGLLTLMLASLAAFMESDGKKVVALSTLSQLGLMVLSLSMGNLTLCLFHVITHAMAKANLFLVVGNYLHSGLSQQDARKLSLGVFSKEILVGLLISILSLSGFLFLSGFFSKEQIMSQTYFNMTSGSSLLMLFALSSLTLGYCIKLLLSLTQTSNFTIFLLTLSKESVRPIMVLSTLSVLTGALLTMNLESYFLFLVSTVGIYWVILGTSGMVLLLFSVSLRPLMGFNYNNSLIDWLNYEVSLLKGPMMLAESSLIEPFYLYVSTSFYKATEVSTRSVLLIVSLLISLTLFY